MSPRNRSQRTTGCTQSANRSLQFESLENRNLLTTMLVNFHRDGSSGLDTATAADFAVADPAVELTAPVNLVDSGGATGLTGTNSSTFDVSVTGSNDFTTNKGVYENEPILDSYLFVNNTAATVTVSGLEEIATGNVVYVTLFGVGDGANQESLFTLRYDGVVVGTDETDYGASYLDTYTSFSFTKVAGVDSFEVDFENAGNGSNTGALNGLAITTANAVRINAGGGSHVDSEGNLFLADQYFSGSRTFSTTSDIFIPGTGGDTSNDEDVDDILYQTERYDDNLNYEIPVANGFYTLKLHYAELYFDGVGERIFDVLAEGNLLEDDLDIFEARQNAFTPGKFAALIQQYELVEVTDGAMSLQFESLGADGVDNGKISAIEIIPVDTPQLAIFPTDGETTVIEGGATDTYELNLTVAPTHDVTVTINTGSEVSADLQQLTFTPSNYDQPQTVILTAVDDVLEEGTQSISVTHTLSSLDLNYDGIAAPTLLVTVVDDEVVPVDFDMRTLASDIANPITGAFGPDNRLYVANQSGQIYIYTLSDDNNVTDTQIVDTIANEPGYNNVLGIAFNPFEEVGPGDSPTIYVTRSSLFDGTEEYGSRVSTLSGTNYTTITDIVTGLPVSGFDHGINGIEFDGNGDLLIAVGGNTNTGEFDGVYGSQAPESPLTSAILLARITEPTFNGNIQYEFIDPNDPGILQAAIDAEDPNTPDPNSQIYGNFVQVVDVPGEIEVETFAVGLRNPFDLVYTTEGYVFSTDNGPNGIAEDELNYIPEDAFLGHPSIPRGKIDPRQTLENAVYDVNIPSTADYTAPLAELQSSTNGIDEYRAETFGGQLRGQLFAQKWNGQVYFFERDESGTGLDNVNTRTDVADGLDILAGPGGTIIGIDRNQNRITIAEPVDPTVTEPTAYDIFNWRAPAVGGNEFVIGGANFGDLANTTVTIGGQQATLTSVSEGKIIGILPAVPGVTLRDVVVTSAGVTSTLVDAFLPLGGVEPIAGDYDFDGTVDGNDYLVWKQAFGSTTDLDADGNKDGVVNAADFTVWRDNLGATQPAAVQEPASLVAAAPLLEAASVEPSAAEPLAALPETAANLALAVDVAASPSAETPSESSPQAEATSAANDDALLLALAEAASAGEAASREESLAASSGDTSSEDSSREEAFAEAGLGSAFLPQV